MAISAPYWYRELIDITNKSLRSNSQIKGIETQCQPEKAYTDVELNRRSKLPTWEDMQAWVPEENFWHYRLEDEEENYKE